MGGGGGGIRGGGVGVGHVHFLSKLGVGRVTLRRWGGGRGGDFIALIECQEYQTESRK